MSRQEYSSNLSCLLAGPGKVRFEDRPQPVVQDAHDVLVRIAFVGVCGSDVHFWQHGGVTRLTSEEHPLVMGHEASGVVSSIGPAVTRVRPGDRVCIEPGFPCRFCRKCKSGKYNLCPKMRFAADPPDNHGTLCEIFKAPEDFVYKIPDFLSLQEAVLVEPLSVAVHGVRLTQPNPGQTVLVQGSGTIGLLSAAVAKQFGFKAVYIADINKEKLEFARTFVDCTTFCSDAKATPQQEAVRLGQEAQLGDGVDVVLECTGIESSSHVGLLAMTAGGTFVQIGLGKPVQALPLGAMCEKEIVVKTAFRYGPGDYEIALDLLATRKISVSSLISSIVPFTEATRAWERTQHGQGIKNLIKGVNT